MFKHLQIYDSQERLAVGCVDALLRGGRVLSRLLPKRSIPETPHRILLLRLERIGDLLMTLDAIAAVRARAPRAMIHLVVGRWNTSLVELIPGIDSHESLSVPWLARQEAGASAGDLFRQARAWRTQRFDLAVNFEPDIRSNLLLALSGAPRRVGYASGGGAGLLTDALEYNPAIHTSHNALRLVDAALPTGSAGDKPDSGHPRLSIPQEDRRRALQILRHTDKGRLLVGVHASGGRPIKQWHLDRFAQVATRLARDVGATIVLTGTPEDRRLVDRIVAALPADVARLDVVGAIDLPVLAGLLERLDLFVTCDTGPMHLAAAVGTPVVALFGPSDPRRYGPLTDRAQVVTANLWCRPCNRVRRPPDRCAGHVPDCLDGIGVDQVYAAARDLLRSGQ